MRQAAMQRQRDILDHAPAKLAEACLAAAETAEYDPHFTAAERKARAEHYRREAERLNKELQR